jgi:hypothetical protein
MRPYSRCVTADEIDLQLGQSLWWDGNFGQFSESGRYTVHDFAVAHDAVDMLVCAQHPRASGVCKRDPNVAARDRFDISQR